MEKYSPLIIEYIQSKQKEKLMGKYGIGFEEKLSEIFPSNDSFLDFIEKDLEKEFGDSYDDPRFTIKNRCLFNIFSPKSPKEYVIVHLAYESYLGSVFLYYEK